MKFLLALASLVVLVTVQADKVANDPNLFMVLVKALQGQLKTCMDQNRDLVQRSCQKPGHWGGNGGYQIRKRAYAFHAKLSKDISDLPHNHKVVFDKVHLNEGGAYDPKTGTFTCKEPGIYVFDWSIQTQRGKHFNTDLMVDGVVQGILNVDATHIKDHRSGSNTVVLKLEPGNQVWVEPSHRHVGQFAYAIMSSFSGFKI